ncbi:hypothetical protein Ddye_011245 [Dipteronia dyeriana]|uniref:NB-ARC domain-containing protein n=1 Tax=Dipteronia dyeriana TaxID=168575 RepID=A0AAD9X186_9ROSI|nr:hypothetical protein Ddye_011245 [Dipteronia dyeriana]
MRELKSIQEDLKRRVEREEQQDCYLKRTSHVENWLLEVDSYTVSVNSMLQGGDGEIQRICMGYCCPTNCLSRVDFVTEMLRRPSVDEIPMEKTVGIDSIFNQLWSCFQDQKDNSTEIIGLYGTGGVGKTTLLKKLNNNFLREFMSDFHVVIWVVVSREVNLWKIQEVIREKLEMADRMWKSKNTKLKRFPSTFFQSKNVLKVLDLSYNRDLTELPVSIGELINLHHLNLSYTNLKVLPIEIQNLTQLRILLLDDTKNLEAIPTGLILSLSLLEVFSRLLPTTVNVLHHDQSLSDIALLQELECLENISDISLTLSTFGSVVKFKASSKLQCCIKRLTIMCSELEILDISSLTMKRMEHLDTLSIRDCHSLRELKILFEEQERMQGITPDCFRNLCYLHIESCSIKDLTWLKYAIYLPYLWVDNCPSLEEIIADDFGSSEIEENMDILSKIESINLVSLPSLKSICRRALLFPCLQNVEVINCSSLRKLPFESGSAAKSLKAIKGSKTWWDELEWDDAVTKDAFASKFFDSDFVLFKPTVHSDYTKNLL